MFICRKWNTIFLGGYDINEIKDKIRSFKIRNDSLSQIKLIIINFEGYINRLYSIVKRPWRRVWWNRKTNLWYEWMINYY